ncbi:MAG: protease, partial [Anaerolineae bacterium]
RLVAFSAQYEGPTELYTMPVDGGRPQRHTFEDEQALVAGWTPDGKVIYSTARYATLPNTQLRTLDPQTGAAELLPLAQAGDGRFDDTGETLFFTRLPFQGSHTKRYKGGTVQSIWKFTAGSEEALPLTADYPGTSKTPMWWNGRVYFATDRDGTMNVWSMDEDGGDLQQHTFHKGWDVQSPALHRGRIVYQLGADLHLLTVETGETEQIEIYLASDLDQTRQRWVKRPIDYLTGWQLSPNGDRVALTARGKVFVAPVEDGRFVAVSNEDGVRYRSARFFPNGSRLLALSDSSGELEFYQLPADGLGAPEQLTNDGTVFRFAPQISPDGKWFAYADKGQRLWVVNVESRESRQVAASQMGYFFSLRWSPDSRWLAYTEVAENNAYQIKIYNLEDGTITAVTSDRVDSYSPIWSPDGKWLYFLSDRHLYSVVPGPWGPRQPDPYLEKTTKIYMVALQKELRSPFKPADELHVEAEKKNSKPDHENDEAGKNDQPVVVDIDPDGLSSRLYELPVAPGDFRGLTVNKKALFWLEKIPGNNGEFRLIGLEIKNKKIEPQTIARHT